MTYSPLEDRVFDEIFNNVLGMTKEEAKYWVENDAICSIDSVNGLIYYHDTSEFFDRHEEEILKLAKEFEFDCSIVENGMKGFKNTMSWFAFEALKDRLFEERTDEFDFENNNEEKG